MPFATKTCGAIGAAIRCTLGSALIIMMTSGVAFAQLTADDIEALRARGQAEGWTFTVAENPATKRPFEMLCGLKEPDKWWVEAPFDPCTPERALPAAFDWRDSNACTPIRDQDTCGSCWAFATVAPLESAIKIRLGLATDLSEQWLISCNTDGWGCSGGWFAHKYHQNVADHHGDIGAVLEAAFPYVAFDAPCNGPYPHPYRIQAWAYIGNAFGIPGTAAMKQAILDHGPISVCVHVDAAFQAYTGGVFNACNDYSTNHMVVIVGWDNNQGTNGVWIVRNSWGQGWGLGGYMLIEYGCSRIGYAACYIKMTQIVKVIFQNGKFFLPNFGPLPAGEYLGITNGCDFPIDTKWNGDPATEMKNIAPGATIYYEGTNDQDCYTVKQGDPKMPWNPDYACEVPYGEEIIPTLSEWGMIIFSLLILTLVTTVVTRRRLAMAGRGGADMATPVGGALFFPARYFKVLTGTLGLAVIILLTALAISGSLPLRDIAGTIISAGIVAYIVHLWLTQAKSEK